MATLTDAGKVRLPCGGRGAQMRTVSRRQGWRDCRSTISFMTYFLFTVCPAKWLLVSARSRCSLALWCTASLRSAVLTVGIFCSILLTHLLSLPRFGLSFCAAVSQLEQSNHVWMREETEGWLVCTVVSNVRSLPRLGDSSFPMNHFQCPTDVACGLGGQIYGEAMLLKFFLMSVALCVQ